MTGLLVGFSVYLILPGITVIRSTIACAAGLIAAALSLWTDKETYRKRLHKLGREQIGTDRPFTVTVELLDTGISFSQMGAQIIYEWASIERAEETADALYFFRTDNTCSAVRKRGFESDASKDEFLKLAKNNIQRSRGPFCSKL